MPTDAVKLHRTHARPLAKRSIESAIRQSIQGTALPAGTTRSELVCRRRNPERKQAPERLLPSTIPHQRTR